MAEVRAYLGRAAVTPELRLRVEAEWVKHRSSRSLPAAPPDAAYRDPSVVDSKSVQLQNTVLFENRVVPDDRTKHLDRSNPPDVAADGSIESQGGVRIELNGLTETPGEPTALGRYEVRRVLGSGAFGTVYLGFDPQLSRLVACSPGFGEHVCVR